MEYELIYILLGIVGLLLLAAGIFYYLYSLKKIHRSLRLNHVIFSLLQESVYTKSQEAFYQKILEGAIACIDQGKKGSIMLMDTTTNKLFFAASVGYDMNILRETYLELEQTYLYRESKGKIHHTVKIHNPFDYDRKNFDLHNIRTILKAGADHVMTTLSTPIYYEGRLHGMINVDSPKTGAYDSYDIEIIELFAAEIANVLKLFKTLEENFYHMNYDMLTSLPNRKHINEFIDSVHQEATNNHNVFSFVSMDLNNLKKTNDFFGHPVGDKLLVTFSDICRKNIPKESQIGRYGGDEFMLVLPNLDKDAANSLMNNISSIMPDSYFMHEDQRIDLSFCYGIASYPEDGSSISELIRESDRLMYEQKRMYHERSKT
ncbi:MAG: GGDEF domain-containing protein [Vallitaleaceae bacterium]|nr:GGDEF domain-containing protein [Vallitaleaceae bacterium]